MDKSKIVEYVNTNCVKSSCLMCAEADKYESYTKCPYLKLKQIARTKAVTIDDID